MGPKDEGFKIYQRNLEAITERGWPVIGPIIVLLGKRNQVSAFLD